MPGWGWADHGPVRTLAGLISVGALAGLIVLTATLFRDGFGTSIPVTVHAARAGLVLNPDAKVQFHGVQVGKVSTIEELPDGRVTIELAIEPASIDSIPTNVTADIASPTIFGPKVVRLVAPEDPSVESLRAGQVLDADHVMTETNTLFQQLVSVLDAVQPEKLNETLGAMSAALNGQGEKFGQLLGNLHTVLGRINPSLAALNHDLSAAPGVVAAYADAAPQLMDIAESMSTVSNSIVAKQSDLDAVLLSATGMAEVGNQVLTDNRDALGTVIELLVPSTDLTNQYHEALYCVLGGMTSMAGNPPLKVPGVEVLAGFLWGHDRYRFPGDLPKVAATGGPFCNGLPKVPFGYVPPFVISDVGTNPWKYNNPGIVLNSDGLKQALFGPLDGPPRNSAQIGQPG